LIKYYLEKLTEQANPPEQPQTTNTMYTASDRNAYQQKSMRKYAKSALIQAETIFRNTGLDDWVQEFYAGNGDCTETNIATLSTILENNENISNTVERILAAALKAPSRKTRLALISSQVLRTAKRGSHRKSYEERFGADYTLHFNEDESYAYMVSDHIDAPQIWRQLLSDTNKVYDARGTVSTVAAGAAETFKELYSAADIPYPHTSNDWLWVTEPQLPRQVRNMLGIRSLRLHTQQALVRELVNYASNVTPRRDSNTHCLMWYECSRSCASSQSSH